MFINVDSLGISSQAIILATSNTDGISHFPCNIYTSFSCLTVLDITFKTVLSNRVNRGNS